MEFLSEKNADSAIKIMNMIKLYGKPTGVNKASAHNKNLDVGANIFIGNLDPEKSLAHSERGEKCSQDLENNTSQQRYNFKLVCRSARLPPFSHLPAHLFSRHVQSAHLEPSSC